MLNWEVEKVQAILEERLVKDVQCLLTNNVHKSTKFQQYCCLFQYYNYVFHIHSVENLVDSPDAFGMSPLMVAAQKGYTRLVQTGVYVRNFKSIFF